MCGIHFTLSPTTSVCPDGTVIQHLRSRGPDSFQQLEVTASASDGKSLFGRTEQYHLNFSSSVLSLRGDHTAVQPFQDRWTGSVLCWNGEAWKIGGRRVSGNDGEILFSLLTEQGPSTAQDQLSQDAVRSHTKHITAVFGSIQGPYAFVYYDASIGKVFFGRDCLGRRSLLNSIDPGSVFTISSVCARTYEHSCDEVKANGIYVLDLWETTTKAEIPLPSHIPYSSDSLSVVSVACLNVQRCSILNQSHRRNISLSSTEANPLPLYHLLLCNHLP